MKFKLPKTVMVLGKRIKVILKEELASQGYAGLYEPPEGKIYINPHVTDLEETFLHEFNHSIIHRSGLNQVVSREVEEMICENFATAYAEAFFKKKK